MRLRDTGRTGYGAPGTGYQETKTQYGLHRKLGALRLKPLGFDSLRIKGQSPSEPLMSMFAVSSPSLIQPVVAAGPQPVGLFFKYNFF